MIECVGAWVSLASGCAICTASVHPMTVACHAFDNAATFAIKKHHAATYLGSAVVCVPVLQGFGKHKCGHYEEVACRQPQPPPAHCSCYLLPGASRAFLSL